MPTVFILVVLAWTDASHVMTSAGRFNSFAACTAKGHELMGQLKTQHTLASASCSAEHTFGPAMSIPPTVGQSS